MDYNVNSARAIDTNIHGTMLCVRAASRAMAVQEPNSRRPGDCKYVRRVLWC